MRSNTKKVVFAISFLAIFISLTQLFAASPIKVGPSETYKTIQAGIDAASPGDTVEVAFGNYTGRVVIGKNKNGTPLNGIILQGAGTGLTFLNISSTGGTAVTFDNISGSTIRGFTIKNADIAIKAEKSKANITNNIFYGNVNAFENRSSYSRVTNNTFYNNTRAIFSNSSSTVMNNIIAGSTRYGIAGFKGGSVTYNLFNSNTLGNYSGVSSIPTTNINGAPLFVSYTSDFHLRSGSPAIKAGTPSLKNSFNNLTSDIGAYGGPDADTAPAAVSGITAASATDKATISWNKNMAYNITGYRIYYRKPAETYTSTSFVPAGDIASIDLTSPTNIQANQRYYFALTSIADNDSTHESAKSAEVAGAIDTAAPAVPTGLTADIGDRRLYLRWDAVINDISGVEDTSGVRGYEVNYRTSIESFPPVDVGNVTSYELPDLSNGTMYYIAIRAVDNAGNKGGLSEEVSQTPQEVRGIAGFKNSGGCFIATAAYGSYEEGHVKILRKFRDSYLLTNILGRAFVSFYYTASPPLADFITEHPWLKPVVRVVLLPLIAFAWMLINHNVMTLFCAALLAMDSIFLAVTGIACMLKKFSWILASRGIVLFVIFLCLPAISFGDEINGFTFGFSYGQLEPASDEWKEIYETDRVSNARISLGYRFNPALGVEVGGGYMTKNGKGKTVTGLDTGAETTFQMAPVDMTLLYRLNFFPDQFIVPYIGGGISYNLYWEKVKDGKELKGGMWGHHATGGAQFLLDRLDRSSARNLEEDYGIENTYLTINATHSVINDFGGETVNIGGWNYQAGLLFEF